MTEVGYAVEGFSDEPVAERLIAHAGCFPRKILAAGGKNRLDPKIPGYNRSARHRPWLVLRDLDHDDEGSCIGDVVRRLADGGVASCMALRLAVRTVESWMLADVAGFSRFFRVPQSRIPRDPDILRDPKKALVLHRERTLSTESVPALRFARREEGAYPKVCN